MGWMRSLRCCGPTSRELSAVIASEAKQSICPRTLKHGLLRRVAPRKAGVRPAARSYPLHPAPFRDEQRGRFRRLPQRFQIDILVEAMHRRPRGAEAQARYVVVQSVEPRIGQRGECPIRYRAAIDGAKRLCKSSFG